jgi:hypothetical protein
MFNGTIRNARLVSDPDRGYTASTSGPAINHMLFYGQSLSVGSGSPVLTTTQPYNNLTFSGGVRVSGGDYSAAQALIEDTRTGLDGSTAAESCCSSAANHACALSVSPTTFIIFASTAGHSGYQISQLSKGQDWYTILTDHVSHAYNLARDGGRSYEVKAICYLQGENDADHGTTYATYRAALIQLQSDVETDIKAITGQATSVQFITYQLSYYITTNPYIALALLDVALNASKFYIATPMYHIPYADGGHPTNVGYDIVGAYFGRSFKVLVQDSAAPKFIKPLTATKSGTTITVSFTVPVSPLVLDTVGLASTTNYGFKVTDDSGTLTLSGFSIVSNTQVQFSVNRTLSTNPVVRYALDYLGTGLIITGGASGNLRDSETDTVVVSGTTYNLWNVCPHFQLSIT